MKISIIIPAYNVEDFIETCIQSVINQTYANLEIIIINDGSIDNTLEICNRYCKADERIKLINKRNTGVSDSRNKGIQAATGDYIFFLDSDDWIESDYLEEAVAILKVKDVDILFNGWMVDVDDNPSCCEYDIRTAFLMNREKALELLVSQRLFGWGSVGTFIRRDIVKQCRFDESISFGEDFYFKYQAIKLSESFFYSPINKYHYVRRKSSATKSYSIKKRADDLIVIKRVMDSEKKDLAERLYFSEFVPRLIEYSMMAFASSNEINRKYGEEYKKEVVSNFKKILFSQITSRNTKIKMFLILLPSPLLKIVGGAYLRHKNIKCE